MTTRIIPVDDFTLVVFGAVGDLATRKIYPALWQRILAGQAKSSFKLIGVSRQAVTDGEFRAQIAGSLPVPADAADAAAAADKKLLDTWLSNCQYLQLDIESEDPSAWELLGQVLTQPQTPNLQVLYFALPPSLAKNLCHRLSAHKLIHADTRVVLEKPFGSDYASAKELNQIIDNYFSETQIYRIDHYLGKETVQNLMALRFANSLFEPLWNSQMIDHIQITVAESLGVGNRVNYYDGSGATRDMIQNHLLQLLCLVAMEPPIDYSADSVRDEKLKVLQSLAPMNQSNLAQNVVAGQYVKTNECEGFTEELGKKSNTETYIAIKCAINNWRWANVPFYLRTGKRLSQRVTEIVAQFKAPPHSIFSNIGNIAGNQLIMRLQPHEGITLKLNIKEPGLGGFRLSPANLDMSFTNTLEQQLPDAYERLVMDVVRGNQTLFMRADEVEAAWKWVDPIISYLNEQGPHPYLCNSSGPNEALRLMHADGRSWREII